MLHTCSPRDGTRARAQVYSAGAASGDAAGAVGEAVTGTSAPSESAAVVVDAVQQVVTKLPSSDLATLGLGSAYTCVAWSLREHAAG